MPKRLTTLEDIITLPSVNLLLGKRGAGKSALCHYLLEKLSAKYRLIPGIVGFPREKRGLLPDNFHIFENFNFPKNAIVFIDEGSFFVHARRSSQASNIMLDQLMATARHKNLILLIATHHSTKIDISVIRDSDAILFKEPSRLSVEYGGRVGLMHNLVKKAKEEFDKLPKTLKRGYVYVFCEEFEGMLFNMLPSFWSEELSRTTVRNLTITPEDRK